ncbi:hypothetical protein FT663_04676 [Candidozyma haemuli var. vulneris]|nr:hypothetical protein FT663_04676 [[Candida] haemuloni var. vulneris]KAF3991381.1 hypothetical protein FT662_01736 [[Candida] haemuloni var. vulneris]
MKNSAAVVDPSDQQPKVPLYPKDVQNSFSKTFTAVFWRTMIQLHPFHPYTSFIASVPPSMSHIPPHLPYTTSYFLTRTTKHPTLPNMNHKTTSPRPIAIPESTDDHVPPTTPPIRSLSPPRNP